MILATIELAYGETLLMATLTEAGWMLPDRPTASALLDMFYSTSNYGPADGDPVACAAAAVANDLNGRVTFVRKPAPAPPGRIY